MGGGWWSWLRFRAFSRARWAGGGGLAVALVLGVVVLGGVAVAGVRRGVGGGRVMGVGGLWRAWGVRGGVVKLNSWA